MPNEITRFALAYHIIQAPSQLSMLEVLADHFQIFTSNIPEDAATPLNIPGELKGIA
jgi:hypothetical protein